MNLMDECIHRASQLRICLIEDDDMMRNLCERRLSRTFNCVHSANGPEQGAAILNVETIDVVISDYRMPNEEQGLSLLTHIKTSFPQILVIIMSADMSDTLRDTLVQAGADLCVDKPLKLDEVLDFVVSQNTRSSSSLPL